MPKKFYKKSKRSYAKRHAKSKNTLVVNRPAIADNTIVKLRYHTTDLLDPATGLGDNIFIRANSIYDPEVSVGGHRPYGTEEWSQFYRHYVVLGSKITVRFVSQGDLGNTNACLAGVGLQRDTNVNSDPNLLVERRDASMKILTQGNAKQTCTLTKCYSAKRFHGYTDLGDSAETRTVVGTDPADQAYYNVFLAALKSSDNVASTPVSITVDYIVKFSERKDLLTST